MGIARKEAQISKPETFKATWDCEHCEVQWKV